MSEEQVGVNGADTQGYNAWLESLRQRLIGSKWSDKLGNGVKSVLDDAVLTHYESMPTGWWWQRLVRSVYWYWHSVKGCQIRSDLRQLGDYSGFSGLRSATGVLFRNAKVRRAVERKLGEVSEVSTKVAGEAGEGGEALSADLKSKDEERAGMGTCTSKEAVAVMDEGEVKAEEHAGGNGGSASWVVVNPVQSGRLGGAGKPADSKGIHGSVQAARVGESGSLVLAQGPAMYNAIQTWSMLDSKAFAHALVPNPMLELPEARFELPIVIPSHGLPASVLSRLGIEVREETGIRVSRSVEDMHEEAGIRVGNSAEGMHEPILGDDELVLERREEVVFGQDTVSPNEVRPGSAEEMGLAIVPEDHWNMTSLSDVGKTMKELANQDLAEMMYEQYGVVINCKVNASGQVNRYQSKLLHDDRFFQGIGWVSERKSFEVREGESRVIMVSEMLFGLLMSGYAERLGYAPWGSDGEDEVASEVKGVLPKWDKALLEEVWMKRVVPKIHPNALRSHAKRLASQDSFETLVGKYQDLLRRLGGDSVYIWVTNMADKIVESVLTEAEERDFKARCRERDYYVAGRYWLHYREFRHLVDEHDEWLASEREAHDKAKVQLNRMIKAYNDGDFALGQAIEAKGYEGERRGSRDLKHYESVQFRRDAEALGGAYEEKFANTERVIVDECAKMTGSASVLSDFGECWRRMKHIIDNKISIAESKVKTAEHREARLALEARMQAAEEGRIAAEAQLCAGREARLAMESHLRELEARDVQRGAAVVPAADEGDAARRVGLDDLTVGERRERPLNRGFLGRREDIGGAATAEVRPAAGEGDAGPAAARTNGSGAST